MCSFCLTVIVVATEIVNAMTVTVIVNVIELVVIIVMIL